MASPTIAQLRAMTDEQLITEHDRVARGIGISTGVFVDELRRRDTARSETTVRRLTWAIAGMTAMILVATIVNVVVFILSLP